MKTYGYKALVFNVATYYNKEKQIFVVSYINNCLFIGVDIFEINILKLQLADIYNIEDFGLTKFFRRTN